MDSVVATIPAVAQPVSSRLNGQHAVGTGAELFGAQRCTSNRRETDGRQPCGEIALRLSHGRDESDR